MERGVIRLTVRRAYLVLFIVVILFVMSFPLRTLLAGNYEAQAKRLLDDPETEDLDFLPMNDETMARYLEAVTLLHKAEAADLWNARYPVSLADAYMRIAAWTEAMETLGMLVPQGIFPTRVSREYAERSFVGALILEPTNPNTHLAMATHRSRAGQDGMVDEELEKASKLYPRNSSLRLNVATEYLLRGNMKEALEHAKILATNDDSYLVPETEFKSLKIERKDRGYTSLLANSYLYKAYEITWRASNKDISSFIRMTPDVPEAKDTLNLFLENKGVELKIVPKKHDVVRSEP